MIFLSWSVRMPASLRWESVGNLFLTLSSRSRLQSIVLNISYLHIDASEGLYEGDHEVSGDGSPHEAAAVIVPQEAGRDEEAAGVRPRDRVILLPPPAHTVTIY